MLLPRRLISFHYITSPNPHDDIASICSTVDAFQGRESPIVIFSCVRAGDKDSGIGFLSDIQRMNVALTRAMNFLFVVCRQRSIMANPYWRDLVSYAREQNAIIQIPIDRQQGSNTFPNLAQL